MGVHAEDILKQVGLMSEPDRLHVLRSLLGTYAPMESAQVEVHSTGYVVYASDSGSQECTSWLLAPGTNLMDRPFLGFAYFLGLVYVFLGIAIISDIFMAAIEVITAAEGTKRYRDPEGRMIEYTYTLVNPTVANLTLMALGSSAPEILLSIIGALITINDEPDKLGPSTILGSAAFNLLVITSVCISALPEGEMKRIQDLGVFVVTATFSLLAYVWLFIVLEVSSPGVVEVWEAFVTLGLFGVLLAFAYLTDVRGRCCRPPTHVLPADSTENLSREPSMSRPASTKELMSELQRTRGMERARHMPAAEVGDTQVTGYVPLRTTALRGLTGQRRLASHSTSEPSSPEFEAAGVESEGASAHGKPAATGAGYAVSEHSDADTPAVGVHTRAPPVDASRQQHVAQVAPEPADSVPVVHARDVPPPPGSGPGAIQFEESAVMCEEAIGKVKLALVRTGGADGTLTVKYATRDGTAVAGVDYVACSGLVTFAPGEIRKEIAIEIVDDDQPEPDTTFVVELSAESSIVLASRNRSCSITILDDDSWQERMLRLQTQLRNALAHTLYSSTTWSDRLRDAIELSGGVDEETGEEIPPTTFDAVMHALSLFWKVQFALVPPETWLMGWPAFVVSLGFVGLWTAVVGEIASLFGCIVGLGDFVTALTLVALGTSLPDTFASRLATLHDENADAAVGNITGSNSVNVFLGLGIPWIIGSLYHRFFSGRPDRTYHVPSGSLGFSVAIFCAVALVAIATLMLRRISAGGELGGRKWTTRALSTYFFSLWVIYVLIVSLADRGVIEAPF